MKAYITSIILACALLAGCGDVSDEGAAGEPESKSVTTISSSSAVTTTAEITASDEKTTSRTSVTTKKVTTLPDKSKREIVTIRYEWNGGTDGNEKQGVYKGDKPIECAPPKKKDCAFAGWYTDKELTKEFDPDKPLMEDITLYAKWEPVNCEININTHDDEYAVTDHRRYFDFTVSSSNSYIIDISYEINGSPPEELNYSQDNDPTDVTDMLMKAVHGGGYTVKLLLASGNNTFTVHATTEDGHVESKTVNVYYDGGENFASGWSRNDYEKNGYPIVAVYEPPMTPDNPSFLFPSNVVTIYFTNGSYKESEEFIAEHSDIFEKKVGEINTIDLKEIKLAKPVTNKDSITYDEYIELQNDLEQQLKELSPIVESAFFDKIHIHMRTDIIEPE